jgi:hypothetical protein
MGFWKNLFGVGAVNEGYILGNDDSNVERLFGYDGSAKAINYGGRVYSPSGEYLGNNMPGVRDSAPPPSFAPPSYSGYQGYTRDAQGRTAADRLRAYTEEKLRNG